jgi:hypothetical protein
VGESGMRKMNDGGVGRWAGPDKNDPRGLGKENPFPIIKALLWFVNYFESKSDLKFEWF